MHYPMFSHAPEPTDQQQQAGEERTTALYIESTLEPHEVWAALTEYIHLWWPRQLLQSEESHIDLSTELLLEETADGDILPVARVIQCENEDVLTIAPYPGTRLGRLMGVDEDAEESLSFILDALAPETAEGPLSLLEIIAVPTQVVKTKSWVSTRDRKKQPRYSWVRTPASLELNSREKNYRHKRSQGLLRPGKVVCHEHTGPEHPAAEGRTPHLGAAAHQSRRGTISAIQQSRYAEVKQYLVPQAGRAPHHSCTSACS